MEREAFFIRTLERIRSEAIRRGGYISRQELEKELESLSFSKEQLGMVEEYLKQHRIGLDQPMAEEEYLTEAENGYLQFYLEELKQLETVRSPEEEEKMFRAVMEGQEEAAASVVEWYLPKVVEIAKLYAGQGVTLEDLIGEGNLALASGSGMLCCLESPEEIQEMMVKMIMGAMEAAIDENMQAAEEDQKLAEMVGRVAEQSRLLSEELQRKVTPEELSAETGISLEEIQEAIRISGDQMEHIDRQTGEEAG